MATPTPITITYLGYSLGSTYPIDLAPDGIEGLDLPPIRTSDQERTLAHGLVPGRDLAGGRTITLALQFRNPPTLENAREAELAQLSEVLTPRDDEQPLVIKIPGRDELMIKARPRRAYIPRNRTAVAFEFQELAVEFFASDPLIYSSVEHSAVVTRKVSGAGFGFPATFPISFGASTAGVVSATNTGGATAPWRARLDGPLNNIQLRHLETDRRLKLSANGGIDLLTGQWIDIDGARRSILLLGTADVRSKLTIDSEWFSLAPGANSIELTADTGTGTLTFYWRDASWS